MLTTYDGKQTQIKPGTHIQFNIEERVVRLDEPDADDGGRGDIIYMDGDRKYLFMEGPITEGLFFEIAKLIARLLNLSFEHEGERNGQWHGHFRSPEPITK